MFLFCSSTGQSGQQKGALKRNLSPNSPYSPGCTTNRLTRSETVSGASRKSPGKLDELWRPNSRGPLERASGSTGAASATRRLRPMGAGRLKSSSTIETSSRQSEPKSSALLGRPKASLSMLSLIGLLSRRRTGSMSGEQLAKDSRSTRKKTNTKMQLVGSIARKAERKKICRQTRPSNS